MTMVVLIALDEHEYEDLLNVNIYEYEGDVGNQKLIFLSKASQRFLLAVFFQLSAVCTVHCALITVLCALSA